jgi:predicted GTPase
MDTAIFVLTADPPVSAAEQELLRLVAQASVCTFVVLNKADLLDPAGLPEATPHATAVVAQDGGSPVARSVPGR